MPLLRPRVNRPDKPTPGIVLVAAAKSDPYLVAVLKWIPTEVIGLYTAALAAIPIENTSVRLWASLAGIITSFGWIAFATKPDGKGIAWRQAILAPIAFVFWAMAMQSQLLKSLWLWWEPWMGTVGLIAGNAILPIMDGILRRIGVPQSK